MCVCVIYIRTYIYIYKYITYTYRRLSPQTLNFAQIRHFRTSIIGHLPWNHHFLPPVLMVKSLFWMVKVPFATIFSWLNHHFPSFFRRQDCVWSDELITFHHVSWFNHVFPPFFMAKYIFPPFFMINSSFSPISSWFWSPWGMCSRSRKIYIEATGRVGWPNSKGKIPKIYGTSLEHPIFNSWHVMTCRTLYIYI